MSKKTNPTKLPVHGRFIFKNLLPRFSDTAVALLDGDLGSALRAFSGALGGKNDEPQAQAYTLLWQCMKTAVRRIFEHRFREGNDRDVLISITFQYSKQFFIDLWQKLPDLDLVIDRDFISNPLQHPTTLALRDFLNEWMQREFSIEPVHARVAVAPFPRYLLHEMATLPREDFKQLFEHFEKPFLPAEEKALAFDAYEADLMSEFDRPAFGNRQVSLAEMYVPPYFRFYKPKREAGEPYSRDIFHKPKENILLKDFLSAWLSGNCSDDTPRPNARVMLLLGQPGQGKSSFCQSTAFDLLSENQGLAERVFVVRLRDFENRQEFLQKPLQVVLEFLRDRKFKKNGLDASDLMGGLLILDGLDEFYMNNGLSHGDVDNLLNNLINDLRLEADANSPANPFRCLITSRNNYVRLENHHASDLLTIQIAEMALGEQQQWLAYYEKTLHLLPAEDQTRKALFVKELNISLEKLNTSMRENEKKLLDLVNQPILLQIVVEAEADPVKSENRAKLYEGLFNHLVARKWAKEGQIASLKGLTDVDKRGPKLFRQFLRALAAHIFYSEREYARRSDFLEEPLKKAVSDLKKLFPDQKEEDYLKNLMISFYFKEVRKDSDDGYSQDEQSNYAYEFLHKSLQEYLVAEYCWFYFRDRLIRKDEDGDYIEPDHTAMEKTFDLFSPRLLTNEIVGYIYELAKNDPNSNLLEDQLFPRTKKLMADLAEHSFIWRYNATQPYASPSRKKSTPMEQGVATFYGVLTINSAIVGNLTTSVKWPELEDENFEQKREFLWKRLNFLPIKLNTITNFLALLRKSDSDSVIHLIGANLEDANLIGVDLQLANLTWTNLSGANFALGHLFRIDLSWSYMPDSNFSSAFMSLSNLSCSNLKDAGFNKSNLLNAYFHKSNLNNANFDQADLHGVEFNMSELCSVSFCRADLEGVNFYDANLKGTIFSNMGEDKAYNIDKTFNLDKAKNKNKADWRGTIYEGKVWDEPEEEEE